MDQLETISILSIAELRKILSDNGVPDTSESKEELQSIASETLLTKMMIEQLQEESDKEYLESVELSRSIEQSRIAEEQQEREQTRLEQEVEYEECVQHDSDSTNQDLESGEQEDTPLSPRSLRQQRLQYFTK